MPGDWFWAHARMLHSLEASASSDRMNELLATNGRSMDDTGRSQFLARLEERLSGEERPTLSFGEKLIAAGVSTQHVTEPGVHPGWENIEHGREVDA